MFNTISTPGGSFTTFTPGYSKSSVYEYFSKDAGPVMDADYDNLREAMTDNMKSIELLDEYRNISYYKWGGVIAGVGLIASSFIGADKNHPPKFGLILLGGVISNIAYWVGNSNQDDKLNEAIEVYNGLRK